MTKWPSKAAPSPPPLQTAAVKLKSIPGVPPLFKHQIVTVEHLLTNTRTIDASDPGTGKTRSHLEAWAARRRKGGGKLLVLAPKSMLRAAWGNDIDKFFRGEWSYSIAYANNRAQAFQADVDIYITNIDAAKWLEKQPAAFFKDFDEIIVDESTYIKNASSGRSKAVNRIKKHFTYRRAATGTPIPRSVVDIWNQIFFLDDGYHLGKSYYKFRNQMCDVHQVGPRPEHRQWLDKKDAASLVAGMLVDISIRHILEECVDIPPNVQRTVKFDLPLAHLRVYNRMRDERLLALEEGDVVAVNAATLANKLAQVSSGSVYTEGGSKAMINDARAELVMELVMERKHSIVFFQWTHQRDQLLELAKKKEIDHAFIDGTVSDKRREEIVENYQAGRYQVVFLHPQSAAHGLTFTRGTATIWASPIYQPDIMRQGLGRIYRASQTLPTENIKICANNTIDEHIYNVMYGKEARMDDLLAVLRCGTES